MPSNGFTTIDLFAGAGGLAEGFRQAGFHVLAANDIDERAAETFRANFPETRFVDGPIEELMPRDFLRPAGLRKGQVDVLVGGPPCQAFSVYNHQRGFHDRRSGLFREYLRFVKGIAPRVVLIENVQGILSLAKGRAVEEIHRTLGELGYTVHQATLKAEEYGVPQERRRVVFVGTRKGLQFAWPQPTHTDGSGGNLFGRDLPRFATVRQAIGDLPPLKLRGGVDVGSYTKRPTSDYQRLMRKGSRKLYNHVAPWLADVNLERISHVPPGGSWRDIPHGLLPKGMKRARRCDHTKRYGRLHPDGLACTILTKCDLHWGSYIHFSQERPITPREAARFQSFPDRFRFYGPGGAQFRQIGNAVPVLLAKALAEALLPTLGHGRRLNGTARKSALSHVRA